MKTTIDVAAPLLQRAKKLAEEEGITLKAVVEEALQAHIETRSRPRRKFRLKFKGVAGKGLQPGVQEGDWETIRLRAYEGHGG